MQSSKHHIDTGSLLMLENASWKGILANRVLEWDLWYLSLGVLELDAKGSYAVNIVGRGYYYLKKKKGTECI